MTKEDGTTGIEVTFHPQVWVDSAGNDHDWGRKQLVPADERDAVTFVVSQADGTDDSGNVYPDESYEANQLQQHDAAPDWVNNWDGPYYVTMAGVDAE
jgi:hypothetical protein